MEEFEIVTLRAGIRSLRSLTHQETFHPGIGPLREANLLHVEQQRLACRAARADHAFVIWDVGFGAAANAIAAIESLRHLGAHIELHSFDRSTGPIEFALSHAEELGYIKAHTGALRQLLSLRKVTLRPGLQWHLHLGDFRDQLSRAELPAPQAIFYDPYSAEGNPEMWTLEHFSRLHSRLDPEKPCTLTNYTRSTAMRAAMLLAGFFVGRGRMIGEKAETTIASNRLELLEAPLELRWLERVRNSGNSAPLRAESYTQGRISDEDLQALETCPQFAPGRH